MPLFSVITTVYNNPVYINTTIRSVLSQPFDDFEYLIVNDGSTDNTLDVIREWERKDPRIVVIDQSNQWIYASINNAVARAKGEYILLVNSDDYLHENILKIAAEKLKAYHRPDVIWTKVLTHEVDEQQNILLYNKHGLDEMITEEIYYPDKDAVRKGLLMLCKTFIVQNPHNVYKRELVAKHPFRNDIYGADTWFNADIASDIGTALLIKEVAVDVLEYSDTTMNTSVDKYYDYEHRMFTEIVTRYLQCYAEWGMLDAEVRDYFYERRLGNLSGELNRLGAWNCPLSFSEKVERAMTVYLDYPIWQMATDSGRLDELDRRMVFGIKKLFVSERLPEDSDYAFLNHLMRAANELEEPQQKELERIITHPLNPLHIGNEYYKSLYGAHFV